MNLRRWAAFGLVLGGFGLLLGLFAPASAQPPRAESGGTLVQRLAKKWQMKEDEVRTKLSDLGVEIQKDLEAGRTADVPGLGTLQVARVHQHRETVNGRPVYVDRTNTVQLLPSATLAAAANSSGARPAEEILPADYFYHDLPYGGTGLDRNPGTPGSSARDARPANNPSRKVGGTRRP